MSRRRRNKEADLFEFVGKMVLFGVVMLALVIGGIGGFAKVLSSIFVLIFWVLGAVLVGGLGYLVYRLYRAKAMEDAHFNEAVSSPIRNVTPSYRAAAVPPRVEPVWNQRRIEEALGEIDWYQFEKFCAALLRSEGFSVERKGGAQPDGGVDLIATKNGEPMLVQCKHWKTWVVQEKVIRELLGSMTHYQVKRGSLYVLKGATRPAEAFATHHGIDIVTGQTLSSRASDRLADSELTSLLSSREHHCPKCESPMVWRTGDFTPFWGCSTYPRCRGMLKHSGAR